MSHEDELFEQVLEKLHGLDRPTWQPLLEPGESTRTASKYGGKPWLSKEEPWPTCRNCQKPLQFFLQLNLEQVPEPLTNKFGKGLLQLFCCTDPTPLHTPDPNSESWSSSECWGINSAWEAFSPCHIVRIVHPEDNGAEVEIPASVQQDKPYTIIGWEALEPDYPTTYDAEDWGVSLEEEDEDIICEEDFTAGGNKIYGWRGWFQRDQYSRCPVCKNWMEVLIYQLSGLEISFMRSNRGYITQCAKHKEQVAFCWQT